MNDAVRAVFDGARTVIEELSEQAEVIEATARAAEMIIEAIRAGNKVLLCGNGGSSADSMHLASQIVGRFQRERAGLPAISLSENSACLTSLANDWGFVEVFRRQVEALGRPGDVLIAYSTSGRSENVISAAEEAREMGLKVIVMTGSGGSRLGSLGDVAIYAPTHSTPRIQECHSVIGHAIAEMVEAAFAPPREDSSCPREIE